MLGESVEQRKSYLRHKLSKLGLSTPQHFLKFAGSVLSTAIRIGDLKVWRLRFGRRKSCRKFLEVGRVLFFRMLLEVGRVYLQHRKA